MGTRTRARTWSAARAQLGAGSDATANASRRRRRRRSRRRRRPRLAGVPGRHWGHELALGSRTRTSHAGTRRHRTSARSASAGRSAGGPRGSPVAGQSRAGAASRWHGVSAAHATPGANVRLPCHVFIESCRCSTQDKHIWQRLQGWTAVHSHTMTSITMTTQSVRLKHRLSRGCGYSRRAAVAGRRRARAPQPAH